MSSYGKGYYDEDSAQDAMAIVAKWMGRKRDLKVVYHDGTAVDADIFKGVIRIPRLACSGGLTEESLRLLRNRVYHEAGHIDKTRLSKDEYPSGALFEIMNCIEDRRMERAVAEQYPGAGPVFDNAHHYHNRKTAEKMADGEISAPLWECLVAMTFQSEGLPPKWRLSEKAQKYFDAAYDVFCEWKGLKSAKGSLKLARKVYDILKEVHEDEQKEKEEPPEPQEPEEPEDGEGDGDGEQGESDESQDSDGSDEPQQSGQGDMDDDDESESDEDGEPGEGESSDGDESEPEESDGEESGEDESDGSGSGDDDEDGEESDENSSGSSDEGDESGSDSQEADGESGGSEDFDDDGPDGSEPDDGEEDKGETDEERLARELDEEADGQDLSEFEDEDIARALDDLDSQDADYLSRRDLDEHNLIEGTEFDMEEFQRNREKVAASVAAMVQAMEQALRSRTRCRRQGSMRRGKIDRNRLTQIAKNLSKEVFYRTRQGEKLETAVEIIIDESASMGMGGKHLPVRLVAIAVGEALAQLNIPFEITGTTTKYFGNNNNIQPLNGLDRTNPMVYNHYKTFEQQWARVRHGMARIGSHFHNIDGEAVEYAARRLLTRPEARKIVLSLSDGLPQAGQGNDTKMGNNITRSCERAREAGVEVYGFGIATKDPEKYYGSENFVYLPAGELDVAFARNFVGIVSEGRFKV